MVNKKVEKKFIKIFKSKVGKFTDDLILDITDCLANEQEKRLQAKLKEELFFVKLKQENRRKNE